MSVSASLNIHLNENAVISIVDIINRLEAGGWRYLCNEKITFLPLGDNDLFNWTDEEITKQEFMEIIEQKEFLQEKIGLVLYWKDTDIGIQLLSFEQNKYILALDINRKYIDKDNNLMDVNWYLERIIPCLKTYHLLQYNFSYEL